MPALLKNRNNQIFLAFLVLMGLLFLRLFVLTIVQGSVWTDRAAHLSTKTLYLSAPRGRILDRGGNVLADSISTFNVTCNASGLSSEILNRQSQALLGVLEENGENYIDDFPIVLGENGEFYFTYDRDVVQWLTESGLPSFYTALQAFNDLRGQYGIPREADVYDAQLQLQSVYGVYPPISVKHMDYTQNLEKKTFLSRYDLNSNITAGDAFQAIRLYFHIDAALEDREAAKILTIRNKLEAMGYYSYIPVTIASDVSYETVVEIMEKSTDYKGVDIVAESVRHYPFGKTAAHILGYMGAISEAEKSKYLEEGYSSTDLIGKAGVESAYESILRGVDGIKVVQVNAQGESIGTISDTKAGKGRDVVLTIDLELQQTAEKALEDTLSALQKGGAFQSVWGDVYYPRYVNANVGAVVALEVETGDVLAMASNPSYDPNLFARGISGEDWASLQAENPRDILSPTPLFNVAAMTAVQPGSAFKMVVATAALANGLDPYKEYKDDGYITVGNRTFGCLIWNESRATHGYLNLFEAIEVSCNYYFYNLICNLDHARQASMGLDEAMGPEEVTKYALQYGLGQSTGIEIKETIGNIPSDELKMSTTKIALRRMLRSRSDLYFTPETSGDAALLESHIEEIVGWCEENPSRNQTLERLVGLGVKKEKLEELADLCKFSYFNQAQWSKGDWLNIAIGQGDNAYTPLQMANYVATIGNDGYRNQVSLVSSVQGEESDSPQEPFKVEAGASVFKDILEGMKRVAASEGGSAVSSFRGFPIEVAAKTGSAEKSGKINPADEVAYIQSNLYRIAPRLRWADVETKISELMSQDPLTYSSRDVAVRSAVIQLSEYQITVEDLDAYKEDYDNFAWFVCCAPAENPKIAVAVLIFQGGQGSFGAPLAREIIAKYFNLNP
jgi:penicillin-binding protein 2